MHEAVHDPGHDLGARCTLFTLSILDMWQFPENFSDLQRKV